MQSEHLGPKNILISPLDWGMGHTTRCIPVIQYLTGLGHHVTVAGNKPQLRFLQQYALSCSVATLPGYDIRYARHGRFLLPYLLLQWPKMKAAIRREHEWLKAYCAIHPTDMIISDNRYGFYHASIPSVVLTHQLALHTGFGKAADKLLQGLHEKMLAPFVQRWVVDVPGKEHTLSGKLGHPDHLPANTVHIGLLSHMAQYAAGNEAAQQHILILLSGPEPQRTLLADKLWLQSCAFTGKKIVFVEGSQNSSRSNIPAHISYYASLAAPELAPLISKASTVICRSGYSTLMDVAAFGKPLVLIPTPGQTEQEYLAALLVSDGRAIGFTQKAVNLQEAIDSANIREPLFYTRAAYISFKSWVDRLLHA